MTTQTTPTTPQAEIQRLDKKMEQLHAAAAQSAKRAKQHADESQRHTAQSAQYTAQHTAQIAQSVAVSAQRDAIAAGNTGSNEKAAVRKQRLLAAEAYVQIILSLLVEWEGKPPSITTLLEQTGTTWRGGVEYALKTMRDRGWCEPKYAILTTDGFRAAREAEQRATDAHASNDAFAEKYVPPTIHH